MQLKPLFVYPKPWLNQVSVIVEQFFSIFKKERIGSLLKPNIQKKDKNHKHNLHKISIQLHALIKYTMLITYFCKKLIFSENKKHHKKITIYITMGLYILPNLHWSINVLLLFMMLKVSLNYI